MEMRNVYRNILENVQYGKIEKRTAAALIELIKSESKVQYRETALPVMAIGLPGADNVDRLWDLLDNKRDML